MGRSLVIVCVTRGKKGDTHDAAKCETQTTEIIHFFCEFYADNSLWKNSWVSNQKTPGFEVTVCVCLQSPFYLSLSLSLYLCLHLRNFPKYFIFFFNFFSF